MAIRWNPVGDDLQVHCWKCPNPSIALAGFALCPGCRPDFEAAFAAVAVDGGDDDDGVAAAAGFDSAHSDYDHNYCHFLSHLGN